MRIYRVSVLKPIEARQKKHMVHLYRVGAKSAQEAVAAVRAKLTNHNNAQDWRIVGCSDFSAVSAVILDGVYSCGKEQAKKLVTL